MRKLGLTVALLAVVLVLPATGSSQTPTSNVQLPARGAFVYQWFPETWQVNGQHVSGDDSPQTDDGFHPTAGFYFSGNGGVVENQIRQLDRAKVNVGIASWWGQNQHKEEIRFPLALNRTTALGSPLKWALYYEKEGFGNPSPAELASDVAYIKARYSGRSEYARVAGRPVMFVYNADDTSCTVVERWKQAAPDFYLVMKVFAGFGSCANQPDGWHQYGPATPTHNIGNSFSISPGFWRADEAAPRLARNLDRFRQNVADMVASGKAWQLIVSFNEWGEGTGVEPTTEFGEQYIDVLAGSTAPPPPPPPPPPNPQGPGVTVLAAGDIQNPSAGNATAGLLRSTPHDAVLVPGDLQYESGSLQNFNAFWGPQWGTAAPNSKLYPAPGNHESTKGGYCTYFAGKTPVDVCPVSPNSARQRYKYTLGEWDLFSLDTGTSSGSGDLTAGDKAWLDQQLAASTKRCQLVYYHHPRYSAGSHGPSNGQADDWQMMMNRKVDMVLVGHDHNYQRFARMNANGGVDQANGIREFVVGTGGRSHYSASGNPAGLEVKNSTAFGLLRLNLRTDGYDWRFLATAGSFTDTGSEACR